jgi:hypothetical protein
MGRRGWLAGMLAMTIPGLGGQVPRRPDQAYTPSSGTVAPGSTNIVRARQVIVFGVDEGVFVYNGTPALGNQPILTLSNSSTDPFGNTIQPGMVAYVSATFWAQLLAGVLNFGTPGMFSPAQMGSTGAGAVFVASGQAVNTDSIAEMLLEAPSTSGLGGRLAELIAEFVQLGVGGTGTVTVENNLITVGTGTFGGDVSVNAVNLNVGNGTSGNINLSPKMATPPNEAAVGAGTATLAQTEAFAHGLYSSMKNRGMIN